MNIYITKYSVLFFCSIESEMAAAAAAASVYIYTTTTFVRLGITEYVRRDLK